MHIAKAISRSVLAAVLLTGVSAAAADPRCVIAHETDHTWTTNPDVAAIIDLPRQFAAAAAAQDLGRIKDLYSPDVDYIGGGWGGGPGSVRDAVVRGYADAFAKERLALSYDVKEVGVCGDMAYETATFTSTSTPNSGGEPTVAHGQLLEILRKEEGKWRSFRVMLRMGSDPMR